MYHIYKFTNKTNGKIYVGKSNNVARRKIEHLSRSKTEKNNYFYNAIKKYGFANFELEILASFDNEREAYEAEIYFISLYQSSDKQIGYNSTPGGEGIREVSDETRKKMSEARLGKYTGENNPFYGQHHTQGTKDKISQANTGNTYWLGKHHTEETKTNISKTKKGIHSSPDTEFKKGQIPRSAKITIEQAREIRKKRKDGTPIKILGNEYNLSNSQICKILNNQCFKEEN